MRHKTEELKLCQSKRVIDGFLDIFVAFWFRPFGFRKFFSELSKLPDIIP